MQSRSETKMKPRDGSSVLALLAPSRAAHGGRLRAWWAPSTHRLGFSVLPCEELPHPKFQALKQQETNRVYFIKKGCDQL